MSYVRIIATVLVLPVLKSNIQWDVSSTTAREPRRFNEGALREVALSCRQKVTAIRLSELRQPTATVLQTGLSSFFH